MRVCDIKFVKKKQNLSVNFRFSSRSPKKLIFKIFQAKRYSGLRFHRDYKLLQFILRAFTDVWWGINCYRHLDVVHYNASLCNLFGWAIVDFQGQERFRQIPLQRPHHQSQIVGQDYIFRTAKKWISRTESRNWSMNFPLISFGRLEYTGIS